MMLSFHLFYLEMDNDLGHLNMPQEAPDTGRIWEVVVEVEVVVPSKRSLFSPAGEGIKEISTASGRKLTLDILCQRMVRRVPFASVFGGIILLAFNPKYVTECLDNAACEVVATVTVTIAWA